MERVNIMEIRRNNTDFKITLPKYKIHTKEIKNKNKPNYQYTCILPPLLCSYLHIKKETIIEKEPNLILYKYKEEIYITSKETLDIFRSFSIKQHELSKLELSEDNTNIAEVTNINYNIHDNIEHYYYTTAFNMTNSNSFRFTLPNKLFKDIINTSKTNYILFTIDTLEKDILNHYGTIKIKVIQED